MKLKTYFQDFCKLTVILYVGIAILESIFMLLGLGETWSDVAYKPLFIAVPVAIVYIISEACGMFKKGYERTGFVQNVAVSTVIFLVMWGMLDLGRYLLSKEVNLIADINQAIMLGYTFGVYSWYASSKTEKQK